MTRKSVGVWVLLVGVGGIGEALACPTHAVPLPATADAPAKKSRKLLETPFVDVMTITLKAGDVLPPHTVPHAITIQALQGKGTVKTGDVKDPLSPTDLVLVGPGAEHDVTAESDMVVLVHILKSPGAAPGHGAHEAHAHEAAATPGAAPAHAHPGGH